MSRCGGVDDVDGLMDTLHNIFDRKAKKRMSDDIKLCCPACGHVDDRDAFDVLGADDDHMFCPKCGKEVCPEFAE